MAPWGPGHTPRPLRAPRLPAVSPEPPRFIREPKDQIGVSGGVASFVCQATGDPKPRVTWNKKGKKVNSQRFEVSWGRGEAARGQRPPRTGPRQLSHRRCHRNVPPMSHGQPGPSSHPLPAVWPPSEDPAL